MKHTVYRLPAPAGKDVSFRATVVADLHDRPYEHLLPLLRDIRPDLILIPGDVCERLNNPAATSRPGLGLLSACAAIAPTYYSLGNHEIGGCHSKIYRVKFFGGTLDPFVAEPRWLDEIHRSGAHFLNDDFVTHGDLVIGGLGSGLLNPGWRPNLDWLPRFTAAPGYKLLLSHHPEYFDRYLRLRDIDLVVSGHAHGGQWRIFGRGVYAPDQPLFPKYTSGVHEGRLVISRGVVNSARPIPRFFNPCEVVTIEVGK